MRVLMLSKACVVGIYQRKLELIAQQGIELLALVPPSWKDERGEQKLERVYTQGYRLEELPIAFNGSFHLHFYPSLGRQIHEFRPEIVHIDEEPYNLSTWQTMHLARQSGAKTVFFTWQNIKRDYPPPFNWGEKWALTHADACIAGTESAAEVWREKGYAGPTLVIPQFGTDSELFKPAKKTPERPFTVGYIGRLVEEKGIETLLDAARLVGECCVRIIGGGPHRDALMSHAENLGVSDRVIFVDQMPSTQLPPQYHLLDALVLPSRTWPNWKEQFGRVLVEAMASGVPVIGSDSGAIPGVIGPAGLIFPEGNVDALAEHLRCLQADRTLRHRLAEKGRARFLGHFTHEQIAAETVTLYRQLMAPASSAL